MAEEAKVLAADYLYRYFEKLTDPFHVCLVTYALYMCQHRSRADAFRRMREFKQTGRLKFGTSGTNITYIGHLLLLVFNGIYM